METPKSIHFFSIQLANVYFIDKALLMYSVSLFAFYINLIAFTMHVSISILVKHTTFGIFLQINKFGISLNSCKIYFQFRARVRSK